MKTLLVILIFSQKILHQITDTITTPEIAFTGDTMSDFILDPDNSDVLKSRILVMEVLCPSNLGLAHSILLQFSIL
jgi:hypothetical protein